MAVHGRLRGRYTSYKHGTDTLTDWLARTANECCDITRLVRSLAKYNTARRIIISSKIELRTVEIVPLARAIRTANPPVAIPPRILQVTKQVIDLRQETADDYAAESLKTHQTLDEDDISHQHFIHVLRQVLELLEVAYAAAPARVMGESRKLAQSTPTKKKSKGKKSDSPAKMTNMFERLELEQIEIRTNDLEADLPGSQRNAETRPLDLWRANFELEKQEQDFVFRIWCHLQDLHDIRVDVRESWLQYGRGEKSFLYASMVTEGAFGLLRCADDEFCALHPSASEYGKLLECLNLRQDTLVVPGNKGMLEFITTRDDSRLNDALKVPHNIIELLCPIAAQHVNQYWRLISRLDRNVKNEASGKPQEAASEDEQAFFRHHIFGEVLSGNYYRLFLHRHLNSHYPERLDEFVTQFETDGARTWFVVACQIYMEILDMLGAKHSAAVSLVNDSLLQFQALGRKMELTKNGPQLERAARMLELKTEAFDRGDILSSGYQKQQSAILKALNNYATGLESILPTHAGVTAFRLKSWYMMHSCSAANSYPFAIQAMAFIYKVARRVGLLSHDWQDMEFLLSSQDEKKPLIPKFGSKCKVRQYTAAFEAVLGINTELTRRLKKASIQPDPWKKGKCIEPGARLMRQIIEEPRRLKDEAVSTSTGKMLEIILHNMASQHSRSSESGQPASTAKANAQLEAFTPRELLTTFTREFSLEEPFLNFEYHEFFDACHEILTSAVAAGREQLPVDNYFRNGGDLLQLAFAMVTEAELYDGIGALPPKTMLYAAVEPLKEYLRANSNKFAKQAYHQSSGHIPKHFRPQLPTGYQERQEKQGLMLSQFEAAGTHAAQNGACFAFYHPEMNPMEVMALRALAEQSGEVRLPGYMINDAPPGGARPDGGDANDGDDEKNGDSDTWFMEYGMWVLDKI